MKSNSFSCVVRLSSQTEAGEKSGLGATVWTWTIVKWFLLIVYRVASVPPAFTLTFHQYTQKVRVVSVSWAVSLCFHLDIYFLSMLVFFCLFVLSYLWFSTAVFLQFKEHRREELPHCMHCKIGFPGREGRKYLMWLVNINPFPSQLITL